MTQALLAEFDREMAKTRRLVDCVPEDKFTWKPHERSFTLGRLANHLSQMPFRATVIVHGQGRKPVDAESKAALMEALESNIAAGRMAIAEASDDRLNVSSKRSE